MIDCQSRLPVTKQCQLLSLNRSTAYYQPKGVSDDDLKIMRRIDEMHLKRPFYGSRRIRDWLEAENHDINRKCVQRLMRLMGITALYPKKGTSHPGKGHKIYPYLLKGLAIDRPNQVFCTDITYLPMAKVRKVGGEPIECFFNLKVKIEPLMRLEEKKIDLSLAR